MGAFVREKKIHCGKDHMEVDIYQITDNHLRKRNRRKREKVTAPSQKNLNDKNARRYLRQLAKANFTSQDLHVSCTYKPEYLPETIEEAEKEIGKFIRRIQYRRKKNRQDPIKYIIITEGGDGKRIHHHIIMSGMDRDELEDLWRKPRKKGQKKGDKIGFINADRLQIDDEGISPLMAYVSKDPKGRKRWRSSQNLIKPTQTVADRKWSRKRLTETASVHDVDQAFWAKKFPGWQMISCESEYNEIMGWSIYLELRRME